MHASPASPASDRDASAPGPIALALSGVRKQRGGRAALDGVDIEARAGEALVLLGPNGAGKTTLLQVCAGVLSPDSGTARVRASGELRAPDDPIARRALGFVPQAIAVYPRLTARENLVFFARVLGVPRALLEERVVAALRIAGLTSRAGERVGALSGGMQRRLSFACAIVHAPRLLLLDEPTTGVDAESRALIYEGIDRLKQQGAAIVCSTHVPDEAARLADRVVVMARGRVTSARTREELLRGSLEHMSLHEMLQEMIAGPRARREDEDA
jgi:ABC-2 type transport system ATP-binding protein